ncbi:hypothetical protein GCM10010873_32020 [Cypionkella aquatica]|uniref:Uncharacterized protein n=1 Tax=Cypionkella aquatica TaxID=1756042 RepID=A0AA37TV62_9RHOB|nr:hypothetical protein [Cypionkella aquatica]GLS88228.1 hypothetical protein GCM10010873_32020 [Cypionkella aquatica]
MTFLIWALVITMGCGIALRLRGQSAKRLALRGQYFAEVAALFEAPITALAPTGFPRLSGRHQGALFDLQVVPDTLTYRKLPALWLLVTLAEPTPARATLDVMLRPRGVEPFSNFRDLPHQIATPAGFPEDCAIRSDAPGDAPPASLVLDHLGRLSPDLLKEMVIAPKGLRLVWLAEEADRTRYLAFRDAEMGRTPLSPALLQPLLTALLALRNDLKELP